MPVINVSKTETTMTITAEYDAPVDRVWKLWEDARQLERWWGPPTYPATFTDHDLTPGGRSNYIMTGPEGEKHGGWWRIIAVDAPRRLEIEDGFADESGNPNPDMPSVTMRVNLDDRPGGGTQMAVETTFASAAVLQQMVSMGMEEGMVGAAGQIDELLAEAA